ncbi:MAG: polysaccharide deacetylase family protein [Polyangia bacterium]
MQLFKGKRELLARALGRPLLKPLVRAFGEPGLMGLTYHRICDFDVLDQGVISASLEEFDWQCGFMKDTVRVLSADEVTRVARGQLELREPSAIITFDDGYLDNLEAGRILARHGLPAIFFVTTGFIGTDTITHWDRIAYSTRRTEVPTLHIAALGDGHGPWTIAVIPSDHAARAIRKLYHSLPTTLHDRFIDAVEQAAGVAAKDAHRDTPLFMGWEHVRELRGLGHAIGAHTHSHPILSKLTDDEQRAEIERSRDDILRETGVAPTLLAYPNGKPWTFTPTTKALARDCGFQAAFSFYGGYNSPHELDAFDIKRGWVSPEESRDLFRARVMFPQLLSKHTA